MSYALIRVEQAQTLLAYLEGIGGSLSGNFLDVPVDELDWANMPNIENLLKETNKCIRAAFNDYYNIDAYLTCNNTLENVGDNIAIELAMQIREEVSAITTKLRKNGYNVTLHSYPLLLSRAGDILLEVTDNGLSR